MKKHIILAAALICSTLSSLHASLTLNNNSRMTIEYKSATIPVGQLLPQQKVRFLDTPQTLMIRERKMSSGPWFPLAGYILDIKRQKIMNRSQEGYLIINNSAEDSRLWNISTMAPGSPRPSYKR